MAGAELPDGSRLDVEGVEVAAVRVVERLSVRGSGERRRGGAGRRVEALEDPSLLHGGQREKRFLVQAAEEEGDRAPRRWTRPEDPTCSGVSTSRFRLPSADVTSRRWRPPIRLGTTSRPSPSSTGHMTTLPADASRSGTPPAAVNFEEVGGVVLRVDVERAVGRRAEEPRARGEGQDHGAARFVPGDLRDARQVPGENRPEDRDAVGRHRERRRQGELRRERPHLAARRSRRYARRTRFSRSLARRPQKTTSLPSLNAWKLSPTASAAIRRPTASTFPESGRNRWGWKLRSESSFTTRRLPSGSTSGPGGVRENEPLLASDGRHAVDAAGNVGDPVEEDPRPVAGPAELVDRPEPLLVRQDRPVARVRPEERHLRHASLQRDEGDGLSVR